MGLNINKKETSGITLLTTTPEKPDAINKFLPQVKDVRQTTMERSQSTDNSLPLSPSQIKLAHNVIQKFRDNYSHKAYVKLFNAELSQSVGESIAPDATAKATYKHLNTVSSKNISVLKEAVGEMSSDERKLYKAILDTPLRFKHQTNAEIDNTGYLHNLSNSALHKNDVEIKEERTYNHDKEYIGNDDFVFCSLEIVKPGGFIVKDKYLINQDVVRKNFAGTALGDKAYVLQENNAFIQRGYVTFTDHGYGMVEAYPDIGISNTNDPHLIKRRFPALYKQILGKERPVLFDVKNPEIGEWVEDYRPVFSAQQMKPALALMAILFLRSPSAETSPELEDLPDSVTRRLQPITHCLDDTFKEYIKNNIADPATIDLLIHVACEPEFHIPRMVSTYAYEKFYL